jgi:hypothetical protein
MLRSTKSFKAISYHTPLYFFHPHYQTSLCLWK